MEQNLAVMLGVTVVMAWVWGYALAALHWFVLPALRTGVLQGRGRTYSRAEQPVRFWLGIAFWIVMAVLLAYPAVAAALQVWRQVVG